MSNGIAGVIVRADIATNPQPQTTTDAAGNFQLAGLAGGQLTLRFDAAPANPLYPIWPQTVTAGEQGAGDGGLGDRAAAAGRALHHAPDRQP